MTNRASRLLLVGWSLFAAWVLLRYGVRLALLFYAELGLGMDTNIVDRDFANYWAGGRLVLDGNTPLLFDQPAYWSWLKSLFGEQYRIHAWSYPPHALPLVAPLGFLEYRPALVVFLAVTFTMFVAASVAFVRRLAPDTPTWMLALALAGFVFLQIETTQNGFFTAALLLAAFAFMRERPAFAGLCVALLTIKPQLGFLIPLLALLDRNWKLLAWATGCTAVLVAISIAWFGVGSWQAYFGAVVPYQQHVMTHWRGEFLYMMPSLFGGLRSHGVTPGMAILWQAAWSVLWLAIVGRSLWIARDPLERAFVVLAGTLLISPYSFDYDMGAFSVAASCLAWRAARADRGVPTLAFGVLAVLAPMLSPLAMKGVPPAPLLLAAGLVMLWLDARRPVTAAALSG